MQKPLLIQEVGVRMALHELLPKVREAGLLAAALQSRVQEVDAPDQKKGDHESHTALTHADLLIEDRLGSDILMLFKDASFFGEEYASDRISRFIPNDRPFIITLDPINGTRPYREGLPLYETIVTICDRAWNILGAIVYRPRFDEAFVAWKEGRESKTLFIQWSERHMHFRDLDLAVLTIPSRLHLAPEWLPYEVTIQDAGYAFVDMWSDYANQQDWPYSQADVLLGKCRGMIWRTPWASFIDAAVFGFIVECANGAWRRGELDEKEMMYSYTIAASDAETADFLEQIVHAKIASVTT